MVLISENHILKYKLIDDNPGRQSFWHYITDYMASQLFSTILFKEDFDKNISGYFTEDLYMGDQVLKEITGLILPIKSAVICTESGKESIKFNTDKDFAVFIHEAAHYLHIVKDKGVYRCPFLQDKDQSEIFLEYEAGWRSLEYNYQYKMFPKNDRTILELNLKNMLHYIEIINKKDYIGKDKEYKERQKAWVKSINKFSEIKDFKTEI